jgi:citronellyl-CoA dehydrogenase
MLQFQDERLVACVSSVAAAALLWEETRGWAGQRELFGKPLSKMQNTQFKMVELWTSITAARQLVRACVEQRVAGGDATALITMAKLFCGRVWRQVADECIQLHGGYGYMKESAAGRAFVDSRLVSIGGGSDETMLYYLARQLGF